MYGDFIGDGDLNYNDPKKINIPIDFPGFFLNSWIAKLYNNYYYHKNKDFEERIVSIDKFFYPLDVILNWNRLYGKNGFLQCFSLYYQKIKVMRV